MAVTLGDDLWTGIYVMAAWQAPGGSGARSMFLPIVPVAYVDSTPRWINVVAAAQHLLAGVGDSYTPNGCHTIAQTIAAMAGAPLPDDRGSIVPSDNVDGGRWTAVHRGDQTLVTEWTALLRPGDIVRYDYPLPEEPQHSFVVLDVNGLLVRTIDNWGGSLNDHWTNYQQWANPAAVTINRITESKNTIWQGDSADKLIGSASADLIRGLGGHDWLSAGTGRDQLFGGLGLDTLEGGDDADVLRGEADNDSLSGGVGRNTLSGGASDDRLNVSLIAAQSDFISGRAFHAKPGVSEIRYDRTTGQILGDTDGDGLADWTLTLTNRPALSSADFIL